MLNISFWSMFKYIS